MSELHYKAPQQPGGPGGPGIVSGGPAGSVAPKQGPDAYRTPMPGGGGGQGGMFQPISGPWNSPPGNYPYDRPVRSPQNPSPWDSMPGGGMPTGGAGGGMPIFPPMRRPQNPQAPGGGIGQGGGASGQNPAFINLIRMLMGGMGNRR